VHQIRFWLGLRLQTPLGELTALPRVQTPYLDLSGPTSKGREGRKDGKGGQGGKGRVNPQT